MTDKLTSLLSSCGVVPLPRAKVLTFFLESKGKEVTSRELERKTDLRQPEVSLALSAFLEKKWVAELTPKAVVTKGRPTKLYVLGLSHEKICDDLVKGIEKELKAKEGLITQLRAAMISPKPTVSEPMNKKEEQKVLT